MICLLVRYRFLDSFALKIIAIIAMTFDHVGFSLYPDSLWMRIIGRLTFPIMAFLITEGYRHTQDIKKYMLRLFVFAIISMAPFYLLFGWSLNVFFTLFAGLFTLYVTEDMESRQRRFWTVLGFSLLVFLCDWGFAGVWTIYLMGRIKDESKRVILPLLLLIPLIAATNYVMAISFGYSEGLVKWVCQHHSLIYLGILLPIPLLLLYNRGQGYKAKYLFYIYYPLHLVIIAAIKRFMLFFN